MVCVECGRGLSGGPNGRRPTIEFGGSNVLRVAQRLGGQNNGDAIRNGNKFCVHIYIKSESAIRPNTQPSNKSKLETKYRH